MKTRLMLVASICLAVIMAAISLFGCTPEPTPQNPKVLVYECILPKAAPEVATVEAYYKKLETLTGGAVKTNFNWGGAMGPPTETYGRTLSGVNNVGCYPPIYTPGVFPAYAIVEQPLRSPDAELITKAQVAMYEKGYFNKDFENVKFLRTNTLGPYVLFLPKKKVTSIEDFKGMKIRSPSEGFVKLTKALGASPVSYPVSEAYSAMQKGVIDGDWEPIIGITTFKFDEVATYMLDFGLLTAAWVELMNKDTWNQLPKAGRDYFEANWKQYSIDCGIDQDKAAKVSRDKFIKGGKEILNLPASDYQKMNALFAPIWEEWMASVKPKGIDGAKMASDFYNVMVGLKINDPLIGFKPK